MILALAFGCILALAIVVLMGIMVYIFDWYDKHENKIARFIAKLITKIRSFKNVW